MAQLLSTIITGNLTMSNAAFIGNTANVTLTSITYFGTQVNGNANSFWQLSTQNQNNGANASADFVAHNDIGSDANFYIDVGINSSKYNDPAYTIIKANDSYVYAAGGNLAIGTANANDIVFFANGTLSSKEAARIYGANLDAKLVGNVFISKNLTVSNIQTAPGTSANVVIDPDGTGNLVISTTTPMWLGNTLFVTKDSLFDGNVVIETGGGLGLNVSTSSLDAAGANQVYLYSKNVANQIFITFDTPRANNLKYSRASYIGSHEAFRTIFFARPAAGAPATNTTIFTAVGFSLNIYSNSSQTTSATNTTASLFKSVQRRFTIGANNSATVGNAAIYANVNTVWGGGTTGGTSGNGGGYLFVTRFCYETLATNTRSFVGLSNAQASMVAGAGDYDPFLNTAHTIVGVGANTSTGNIWYLCGINGTARTVVDSNVTINTTDAYEVAIVAQPGNGSIGMKLKNLSNGVESQTIFTTNLPVQNTFMQPQIFLKSNTANPSNISIMNMYLETD